MPINFLDSFKNIPLESQQGSKRMNEYSEILQKLQTDPALVLMNHAQLKEAKGGVKGELCEFAGAVTAAVEYALYMRFRRKIIVYSFAQGMTLIGSMLGGWFGGYHIGVDLFGDRTAIRHHKIGYQYMRGINSIDNKEIRL